jgi:molecular chaperone GrpE
MNDNAPRKDDEASGNEPARGADAAADLDTLRAERDLLQDQLKRQMADLANIRKRHAKEMDQARARALEGFAAELLPVLDNFYLALEAHDQRQTPPSPEAHALVEGLRLVRSLLEGVLERHGLREIPAHGEQFDPNKHEAVGMHPVDEVKPGHVSKVLQRGYLLGDNVLRASRVLVRPPEEEANADRNADEGQQD